MYGQSGLVQLAKKRMLRLPISKTPNLASLPVVNNFVTMSSAPEKTVNVRIKGVVQGVFYRKWTLEKAQELGLKGWVRNRRDGSVEALFSGKSDSVDGMVELCRKGPPAAIVTALDVTPSQQTPDGDAFELKPTC